MLLRNIILCLFFQCCISANILFFTGLGISSHKVVFWTLAKGLARKGHSITFIGGLKPYGDQIENIHEIYSEEIASVGLTSNSSLFQDRTQGKLQADITREYPYWEVKVCEATLKDPKIIEIIRSNQKYDLIVTNTVFGDCGLGFAFLYRAPIIYIGTSGMYDWTAPIFGHPLLTNYKHTILAITSQDVTEFQQRLTTTVSTIAMRLGQWFYEYPLLQDLWGNALGFKEFPEFYGDLERYSSLLLLNTHNAVEPPVPYLPNVVEVGGMHIEEVKPLPKNLEDFILKSGDHGFIYFSLGTLVNENDMNVEQCSSLLEAFSKLKQTIIWKWKGETVKNLPLPKNVIIEKWVPQNDILAHSMIKLFITHGGKLGTLEGLYHGVPMLFIPIFSDQDLHAYMANKRGFGIKLEAKWLIHPEVILKAVKSVLGNQKYRDKAKEYSKIIRDNPIPPLDLAVYWVEYVLRHNGSDVAIHSHSKRLWWFQYHLLDVYAFIGFIIFIVVVGIFILIRYFCCD